MAIWKRVKSGWKIWRGGAFPIWELVLGLQAVNHAHTQSRPDERDERALLHGLHEALGWLEHGAVEKT